MDIHVTLPINAAGHKATKRVPLASSDDKASDIRSLVIEGTDKFDTINYVYVVSARNHLVGVLSLKELLRAKGAAKISEIMSRNLVKAHLHTDKRKVAHIAIKNNIKAIPLTNENNEFEGVFSSDAILETVAHESKLDLLKLSGIIQGHAKLESSEIGVLHSFKYRVPWILIGLFGGLLTASVINQFDNILEEQIILASFIPLIAYVANAVGVQTQTLYVRELAIESKIKFPLYMIKQLIVSALIGVASWLTILGVALLVWNNLALGVFIGLAIFVAIIVATVFALLIPYILEHFSVDPADGGGPFATIIQDLVSVLIYLVIASMAVNYL